MAKKAKSTPAPKSPTKSKPSNQAGRFAHPFFTNVKAKERKPIKNAGTRMTDYVANQLLPIPKPLREPTMSLEEIIGKTGVQEIKTAKSISFHSFGDSGHESSLPQEFVSEAMAKDYDPNHPETSPAFCLHLGDVIYFDNTDKGYQGQFYMQYKRYPGKIIAIPGNHDGELFKYDHTPTGQKATLDAFMENFCQPKTGVPPAAGTIYREMISQPGVYWVLNAPFVDILGLYSNIGEGPGYISGDIPGHDQKIWLDKTLATIAADRKKGNHKALIIAVHHPMISHGGHDASADMLKDIDDSCNKAGIMPDAVLTAHAHSYQRFTRTVSVAGKDKKIPYIVAGIGGRTPQPVKKDYGPQTGGYTYDNSFSNYGFITVNVSAENLSITAYQVNEKTGERTLFEKITLDLNSNEITKG